ncbi:MAG: MBL fold metallo-hydrolase [Firmicutes bacterium]|nr:MBL fold metallo-hydrolase [Bacillota bacterium]
MRKKIIAVFLPLCLALGGCGASEGTSAVTAPEVTGEFSVSFLDVGKADAIVLRTENHTAVIDCGEKGDGKDILECLEENGITELDYLFITHFDQDHVGGAKKVINSIPIGEIITPNYEGNNSEYEDYAAALDDNGITSRRLTETMEITLDDVRLTVYPPMKSDYEEEDNDFSLVISAVHGENTFLFAGDAEEERLSELPEQLALKEYALLKVPHHGRYNGGSEKFISAMKPRYAVITCSEKYPPEDEIIAALENAGAEIYLTSNGRVDVTSDGYKITAVQQNGG